MRQLKAMNSLRIQSFAKRRSTFEQYSHRLSTLQYGQAAAQKGVRVSAIYGQIRVQVLYTSGGFGDHYFEHYFKRRDDPYFETREREERFIEQMVAAVGSAVEKALPGFMAAYITNLAQPYQQTAPLTAEQDLDLSEIDLDFVGE